jgi:diadenosine tetraphosphate (Ap4A) HIT family hydrolase
MTVNPADCPFCSSDKSILREGLAYALYDTSPVAPGHALIIPVRHVADFFDTTRLERESMLNLADDMRALLELRHQPDGYNLGINVGEAAGQTIFHVHLHLIPRYRGDVTDPRGGVRGVIPDKRSY